MGRDTRGAPNNLVILSVGGHYNIQAFVSCPIQLSTRPIDPSEASIQQIKRQVLHYVWPGTSARQRTRTLAGVPGWWCSSSGRINEALYATVTAGASLYHKFSCLYHIEPPANHRYLFTFDLQARTVASRATWSNLLPPQPPPIPPLLPQHYHHHQEKDLKSI